MSLMEIFIKSKNENEVKVWLLARQHVFKQVAEMLIEKVKAKKIANKLRK